MRLPRPALAAALLLTGGLSALPSQAADDDASFYAAPKGLASYANGAAIRTRTVTTTFAGLPLPVTSTQALYKSLDSHDRPTAEVATLMVPTAAYAGTRPLVSFQLAEDSVGVECAPSYTLRKGTAYELPFLYQALQKGFAVVASDYQGPQAQFIAGPQEGHGVLDGIRAARRLMPAGTPVAMWGYSGGAFATGWAAELQRSYAPELRFAGIAVGGLPTDLEHAAQNISDGRVGNGLVVGAIIGLDRALPEMGIYAALNDKGRAAFVTSKDDCLESLVGRWAGTQLSDFTTSPDPLALPQFQPFLTRLALGQTTKGHGVPTAPVYSYHAVNDELIPVADSAGLVRRWCAAGVPVVRRENPVGEHLSEEGDRAQDVLTWLADRFAGTPAPSTC